MCGRRRNGRFHAIRWDQCRGPSVLGRPAPGSGTYTLTGGSLSALGTYVGYQGAGVFAQSGGTHVLTYSLYLGYVAASSGTYTLSGTGLLSAPNEYIGCAPLASLFQQGGGTNAAGYISIASGSRYALSAGTLNLTGNGGIFNQGAIDFSNSQAAVLVGSNCIVDLSQASLTNVGSMTVSIGTDSLLIVPAGFNPSTAFLSYSSSGLIHTAGTTLVVSAGQGFGGWGSINDPVNCQGTITAAPGSFVTPGESICLNNGLVLSGTGTVNLGIGTLAVHDPASGIAGGSLSAGYEYIGFSGAGTFTQSAGTNAANYSLILGFNAGDSGTYNLNAGSLYDNKYGEQVGFSGTGIFTQSGGTNATGSYVYLGRRRNPAARTTSTAAFYRRPNSSAAAVPPRSTSAAEHSRRARHSQRRCP